MSADTKKRGIVDPWRVTAPLTPPPPSRPVEKDEKVDLADIDFDADIRASRACVFRGKHASVEVINRNISTENDALRDLTRCLVEILELKDGPALFDAQEIGFQFKDHSHATPKSTAVTSSYTTTPGYLPTATIWFHDQDLDQGLLGLVRLLRRVQRRAGAEGENILKRWGIVPMLR